MFFNNIAFATIFQEVNKYYYLLLCCHDYYLLRDLPLKNAVNSAKPPIVRSIKASLCS